AVGLGKHINSGALRLQAKTRSSLARTRHADIRDGRLHADSFASRHMVWRRGDPGPARTFSRPRKQPRPCMPVKQTESLFGSSRYRPPNATDLWADHHPTEPGISRVRP